METKNKSYFKEAANDKAWFMSWVSELEKNNKKVYQQIQINTSLGKTHVWGLNTHAHDLETLVIFPGARTTALFWDFDNGLDHLKSKFKIYMVETNGLPNLSDGNSPDIKSNGYGEWALEVFEQLQIKSAFVAGASFGGLICMKLAIVAPQKVKAAFLLNPGCLQPFSMSIKNLYYNLLPIIVPNKKNVSKFLNKAVFSRPVHQLSDASEKLIIDYEVFALKKYKDNTQKPYYMDQELSKVKVDTFLFEGDKDLLFPFRKSIKNAREKITTLKDVIVFDNVGHGIETYNKAIQKMGEIMHNYHSN